MARPGRPSAHPAAGPAPVLSLGGATGALRGPMLNAADLNTLAHPSQNFCPPASAPDHPAILQHPGLASKRACAKSDGGAARERPISGSRQRADRSGKEVGGGRRDRDPGAGANCNRRRAKSQRPGTPAGGHRRQSSAAPSGSRSRDFMAECHAIFRLPRTHSRRVMFTAGVTASIGGPASGRGARALASLPGFGAEFAPPRPQAASCLLGGGEARRDASPGILDGFEPVGHDDPEFMRAGKRCRMSELGRRLGLEEPFPRDCGGIDWKDILAEGSDASPSTEGATTDDAAEAPPDPATEGRGVQIQDSGRRRGRPPREAGAGGKRRKTRRYTRKPKLDTLLTKLVRCTRVYKVACEHGKKEQHDYIEDINCLRRLVQDLESYKNQAQPKPGSQISVTEQNVFLGGLRFILEVLQNSRVNPHDALEVGLPEVLDSLSSHRDDKTKKAAIKILHGEEWARDAWALHAAELRKEAARKRGR